MEHIEQESQLLIANQEGYKLLCKIKTVDIINTEVGKDILLEETKGNDSSSFTFLLTLLEISLSLASNLIFFSMKSLVRLTDPWAFPRLFSALQVKCPSIC